jgi:hypothetical protein
LATPGQLMDEMAAATGSNRATIESLYNGLRDSGEIPKGARGKNALHVTSTHAAKLLIAVCCAEHVKDAANAVRRYSGLDAGSSRRYPLPNADELMYPGPGEWGVVSPEFPRLGQLPKQHCLIDALVALVDSYIDNPEHSADVSVSFGSPYPWAEASVHLEKRDDAEWRVSVTYSHINVDEESRYEDDPDFLALIDPSKERQRRRFSVLSGDLRVTAKITQNTLRALGALLAAAPTR